MSDTTPGPEAANCTCTPGMCSRGDFCDHQGDSPGCMSCADLDPDQPCYAGPTRGDPVAARLGYLRACMDAAIEAPEAFDLVTLLGEWGKALDVLAVLLARHVPYGGDAGGDCQHDGFGWPCPDYRTISTALLGKDGTDEH
jgi:hypothetical protein